MKNRAWLELSSWSPLRASKLLMIVELVECYCLLCYGTMPNYQDDRPWSWWWDDAGSTTSRTSTSTSSYLLSRCRLMPTDGTTGYGSTVGLHLHASKEGTIQCPDVLLLQTITFIVKAALNERGGVSGISVLNMGPPVSGGGAEWIPMEQALVALEAMLDLAESVERYSKKKFLELRDGVEEEFVVTDPLDNQVFAAAICCQPRLQCMMRREEEDEREEGGNRRRGLYRTPTATQLAQGIARSIESARVSENEEEEEKEEEKEEETTSLLAPLSVVGGGVPRGQQKKRTTRKHRRLTSIVEMEPGTLHTTVEEFRRTPPIKTLAHTVAPAATASICASTTSSGAHRALSPQSSTWSPHVATTVGGTFHTSTREERDLLREIHDLKNELERRKEKKRNYQHVQKEIQLCRRRTEELARQAQKEKEVHQQEMNRLRSNMGTVEFEKKMIDVFLMKNQQQSQEWVGHGGGGGARGTSPPSSFEVDPQERSRQQSLELYQTDWARRWTDREEEYQRSVVKKQQEHRRAMMKWRTATKSVHEGGGEKNDEGVEKRERSQAYQMLEKRYLNELNEVARQKKELQHMMHGEQNMVEHGEKLLAMDVQREKWNVKQTKENERFIHDMKRKNNQHLVQVRFLNLCFGYHQLFILVNLTYINLFMDSDSLFFHNICSEMFLLSTMNYVHRQSYIHQLVHGL